MRKHVSDRNDIARTYLIPISERTGIAGELKAALDDIARLRAAAAAAAADHEQALAAAQAQADAAAAAATAAFAAAAGPGAAANAPPVPKRTGGVRYLRNLSGLSKEDYQAVQVSFLP